MRTGFTLIEIIIAILILSTAIIAVFNIFSVVNILTSDSMDHLIATYLAQEGMEIVRNIRDTNWLNMDDCAADPNCANNPSYTWFDGLDSCANGCEADHTSTSMLVKTGDPLYNKDGFYGYNQTGASPTKFKRKIIITKVADVDGKDDHIIKVKVEVSWDAKATLLLSSGGSAGTCGAYNCVTTEETLYDWYNYVNQ